MNLLAPSDKAMMAGYGSFEAVMDVMEKAVTASEFVAGDRFTAADVYFGSQVGWGLQFGSIEKRPAFQAYWAASPAAPPGPRRRDRQRADAPAPTLGGVTLVSRPAVWDRGPRRVICSRLAQGLGT